KMKGLTRRSFLGQASGAIALTGFSGLARRGNSAELPAIPPPEREAIAALALRYLRAHGIPGMSLAVARQGRLVYAQGFGVADRRSGEPVTPSHLFRIASVSKPITSVAIFSLLETGRLRLSDRVLGPGGVL